MSNVLEQIGRAIVRPPRREYSDVDLQEACKKVQKNYVRTDVELPNAEAYLLKTSVWSPPEGENQSDVCIIYCHPNSGNRMDTIRSRALSLATALGEESIKSTDLRRPPLSIYLSIYLFDPAALHLLSSFHQLYYTSSSLQDALHVVLTSLDVGNQMEISSH